MCKFPPVCLLILSACASPVRAEAETWHDMLSKLEKKVFALRDEEQSIGERIAILEEQSNVLEDHANLLRERLAAMNQGGDILTSPEDDPLADADAEGAAEGRKETVDHGQREDELISNCADRIAILQGKDGKTSTAFFVPQEGKTRILASAPWMAGNGNFTLSDMHGNPIPFAQEYSAPIGFDLLGLQPEKEDLPAFELAANNEIPAVGARVLVVVVDAESKGLAGVRGTIRGIGPDNLEIDAELTPEMSGAPILALDSGKVIGIVAEQVSGVADDWALGTRHQDSRDFAIRLDKINEWENSDLTRFANEAAYIKKINTKTRVAFIAHTLLECEKWLVLRNWLDMNNPKGFKEIRETRQRMNEAKENAVRDAKEYSTNPHIIRTDAWTNSLRVARKLEPGDELDRNLVSIYGQILSDLRERERNLSAHLSSYNKERYRVAITYREEGIRVITANADRVGR